jgi:hypothetical protein
MYLNLGSAYSAHAARRAHSVKIGNRAMEAVRMFRDRKGTGEGDG